MWYTRRMQGVKREGTVVKTNFEEGQALVNNGVQEFWYSPDQMYAVPLDEAQLSRLGFTKEEVDGAVKYKKDSFRLVTPRKGDFSNIEMWWREDRRHFNFPPGSTRTAKPAPFHDQSAIGTALRSSI